MAEGDDLIDEAFLYLSEKKYPDGASATRKRIIREISKGRKIYNS